MDSDKLHETVVVLERHGGLPSRDLLLAADQLANFRETIDSINENIEHMWATSPQARRQAD